MARPLGTTQYPEDEPVLDDIEKALAEGQYSSQTAAIKPHLDRVSGQSEESKIKRLLRKLKQREAYRAASATPEARLAESLANIETTDERVRAAVNLWKTQGRLERVSERIFHRLVSRGVDVSTEEGASLLKALVMAELKKPGRSYSGQKRTLRGSNGRVPVP